MCILEVRRGRNQGEVAMLHTDLEVRYMDAD